MRRNPKGRLVTITEAARILKRKPGTVGRWVDDKKVPVVSLEGNGRGALRRLIRLADARAYGKKTANPAGRTPPKGFVTATEAGGIMQLSPATVCRMFHSGKIKGVTAQWGENRHTIYVLKSEAEEYARKRQAATVFFVDHNEREVRESERRRELPVNPIVSANHRECLAARRERFEEMLRQNLVEKKAKCV